jgi:hypothetical protein
MAPINVIEPTMQERIVRFQIMKGGQRELRGVNIQLSSLQMVCAKASFVLGAGLMTSEPTTFVVDDWYGPAWINPRVIAFLPSSLIKRLVGCRAFRFYDGDSLQDEQRRKQPDT